MNKKTLYSSNNASAAAKAKQTIATPKGKAVAKQDSLGASAASTTKIIVRGNPSSTSDHVLFWLDANIDPNNADCTSTIQKLQSVIKHMRVFNDSGECANFLHTIQNQSVFMVVSGSLAQQILPRIHHMSQLTAVFIFCSDRSKYESLTKTYPKVHGISTDIDDICNSLKAVFRQWDEESSDISLISASDASGQKIDHLDPSFMYTQLIKEVLFDFNYHDEKLKNKVFNELVAYCRKQYPKNTKHFKEIDDFEISYRKYTPVWWYTRECFLYHMLNDALREQQTDVLIKMGFFIYELYQHIEQLHQAQKTDFSKKFTVFRGQGLSVDKFEQLKKTKDGLLSFNNFLSTTLQKHITKEFIDKALGDPNKVAVLYTITVDPSISSAPFAFVEDDIGYYGDKEQEMLFSMHTVFRIRTIRQDNDEIRLWHVQLEQTSDNDPLLNGVLDRMRKEIAGPSPSYRLGALMIKVGKFNKAQELYQQLLRDALDVRDKANIYYQLGYISDQQEQYDQALQFYENALKIYLDHFSADHPNIASCYNNMGMVYDSKKDYRKALAYYEKALKIYEKTSSDNDENVGTCYNSIGVVYSNLGDYRQALSYCKRAMEILPKSLPATHPTIATTHNNLGIVYSKMNKYTEAVESYKSAIEIGKQTLPNDHPNLTAYRKNLETVRHK